MAKLVLIKISLCLLAVAGLLFMNSCRPDDPEPPVIQLVFDQAYAQEGDTFAIGHPIHFKIVASGDETNITNFLVEKVYGNTHVTVLDSGLNSPGFTVNETYYQSIEDSVDWTFTVMDRNRKSSSVKIRLYKDPDSQFGGIAEFDSIVIGYQTNLDFGHFFLPSVSKVYFQDSASMYQELVDVLCYFNYSEDNGVNLPSPTFSSPGEDAGGAGYLYSEYYPVLSSWQTRNYTKYDISVDNGITAEEYENSHNDSLMILSYNDVWGKKKYKWAYDGTIVPFMTAAGKKGIIRVIDADTVAGGKMVFSVKIQL